METPVPRRSFRERIGLKKKAPPPPPPPESSSLQLLTTLSPDSWVWEYAAPLANSLGVTSGGVAAGSLAAKAVAAASSASSAGAVVTTLQTIGVATFTTPVGLCLVTTCVVVGGSVLIGRALFSSASKVSEDAWILVEAASVKKPKFMSKSEKENQAPQKSEPFAVAVFDDEKAARKAFKHSRVKSKALFGPQKALVLSRQWQEAFRQVVAAM